MNNYEEIKNMSIEEMVEFLYLMTLKEPSSRKIIKQWLKQEAE